MNDKHGKKSYKDLQSMLFNKYDVFGERRDNCVTKNYQFVEELFSILIQTPLKYEELNKLLVKWFKSEERVLYFQITQRMYSLFSEENNTDREIDALLFENIDENYRTFIQKHDEKIEMEAEINGSEFRKFVVKIYDHLKLAYIQVNILKNQQYAKISQETQSLIDRATKTIKAEMENLDADIREKESEIAEAYKGMYSQIITLIGIFTTIAFTVFGGISALHNLFQGATEIPILKTMIIGVLWAFALFNIVFVFMYFIDQVINRGTKNKTFFSSCTLVKKIEVILLVLFLLFAILYFLDVAGVIKRIMIVIARMEECAFVIMVWSFLSAVSLAVIANKDKIVSFFRE